jgi:hypothetical protein
MWQAAWADALQVPRRVARADTVNGVTLRAKLISGFAIAAAAAGLWGPAAGIAQASASGQAAGSGRTASTASPVVLIGIPGLRWTDISAAVTPALWQLAQRGSVGSLSVHAVRNGAACPADAWLTINGGARATAGSSASGPCPRPAVTQSPASPPGTARPAMIASMPGIERANGRYCYNPYWGILPGPARSWGCGTPAGPLTARPAGCALAVGPGAALALADSSGRVARYATAAGSRPRSLLHDCPLTLIDLGTLPPARPGQVTSARTAALRAADREAGQIIAAVPAGARIIVAGLGDDASPQLRAIIAAGPGFGPGVLRAASTRQPGIVTITDLTPTLLSWRGTVPPAGLAGSVIEASGRASLASAVRMLISQDTGAQVYISTVGWFFLIYAVTEVLVFVLLALVLRGDEPARRRRRVAAYRIAGVSAAAVPAGTFLASLVRWPALPHPALLLYGLGLAWAAVIAAAALTGPWRRSTLGSPGFVCAITVAVIGLDVMTGSRLQLSTPFGLSVVEAGRFYGIGNNALGVYAPAAILCAAWAGLSALRVAGSRGRAVLAAGAVALVVVLVCGWPQFGTKVGGTIALVPAFLVLIAGLAGVRISARAALLVLVSGLAVIALIAVVSYNFPSAGPSDISNFVRQILHGDALSILHRKASANVGSLTETWFTPVVPLVVLITGAMLAWPGRMRQRTLVQASRAEPLLRQILTAVWLVALLGWLADDSGVSVTAAAMTLTLPLAVVLATGYAAANAGLAGYAGATASPAVTTEGPVQAPGRPG